MGTGWGETYEIWMFNAGFFFMLKRWNATMMELKHLNLYFFDFINDLLSNGFTFFSSPLVRPLCWAMVNWTLQWYFPHIPFCFGNGLLASSLKEFVSSPWQTTACQESKAQSCGHHVLLLYVCFTATAVKEVQFSLEKESLDTKSKYSCVELSRYHLVLKQYLISFIYSCIKRRPRYNQRQMDLTPNGSDSARCRI